MNRSLPKVAVVVPRFGLVGGGEKFVAEVTERLARRPQWRIHVFANQWQSRSPDITFHHVPIALFPRFLRPLSFAWFSRRAVAAEGVDLVHAHERIFDADIYTAHGIPHTVWCRDIRHKRRMSLYDRALAHVERRLVTSARCRTILPNSSITEAKLIGEFPGLTATIRRVHPGVDFARFDQLDRTACRRRLREQHGWRDTDRILLFVGMNFEIKGLGAIIHALAATRDGDGLPCARLLVVGKGNVSKYSRMAADLGIGAQVAFQGVVAQGIESVYMGADMFTMLSHFDTFGLTVLEAMAAGLPVVISDCVGGKDVVGHGTNGFVVPPGRIDAIADCFRTLGEPDRLKSMGAIARDTARRMSWDHVADQIGAVYESTLALSEAP